MANNFYNIYSLIEKKQEEEEEKYWEQVYKDDPDFYEHELAEYENSLGDVSVETTPRITKEAASKLELVDDNYCKEDNMVEMVLSKAFPGEEWVHNKTVPGLQRRIRPDFRCERLKLIVEYNGFRHYTQAATILADVEKRRIYEDAGYTVIDWPYWIQPDKNTIRVLFNGAHIKPQKYCDYHQGFIAKGCVLPADFCELGVDRFNYELSQFDAHTILRVLWSLDNKSALYGDRAVFCSDGSCIDGKEFYLDGTKFWRRKIHSFGIEEAYKIGTKIL